jgi:hypothetical protein
MHEGMMGMKNQQYKNLMLIAKPHNKKNQAPGIRIDHCLFPYNPRLTGKLILQIPEA